MASTVKTVETDRRERMEMQAKMEKTEFRYALCFLIRVIVIDGDLNDRDCPGRHARVNLWTLRRWLLCSPTNTPRRKDLAPADSGILRSKVIDANDVMRCQIKTKSKKKCYGRIRKRSGYKCN